MTQCSGEGLGELWCFLEQNKTNKSTLMEQLKLDFSKPRKRGDADHEKVRMI